jgi:hypothetical protein
MGIVHAPLLRRGSALIVCCHMRMYVLNIPLITCEQFDYRLLHRGKANTSGADRPILVITAAKEWYEVNSLQIEITRMSYQFITNSRCP